MGAPGRSTDEQISVQLGIDAELESGRPRWWLRGAPAEMHDRARDAGLVEVRRLHQMRRPLPVEPELGAPAPTRPFDPSRDVEAWLDVNNRAFSFHPDQGGWSADDLTERMAEPWFDLDDFRVHDGGHGLDGFCWTKLHGSPGAEGIGEIYVIASAPEQHGSGLGRALTLAGLVHLWDRYRVPVGMLYVEADNEPALRLYRRLGFEVHLDDVAYEAGP
jgi:mycothiol synthase